MGFSGIGAATLLQAITGVTLLLRPVLSSSSDLYLGLDDPMLPKILEDLPDFTNIEDLALDPSYLYVDAPCHHNPMKKTDAYKDSTFSCKECGDTAADECVLTRLGWEICQLVAVNKHREASDRFMKFHEHLKSHEEMPPNLSEYNIKIRWQSFIDFIRTFTMNRDNANILISTLTKYKNLPPFQLKNIVVSNADFLVDKKSTGNNGAEYKLKLEDCNLRGISMLYERHSIKHSSSSVNMAEKSYNNVLMNTLFYSMTIQKLEVSEQRSYLSTDIAMEIDALKITDFMQLFTKGFIPVNVLLIVNLIPYREDKSIFEPFQSEVQKVIKGTGTTETLHNILSWFNIFRDNGMVARALSYNFQISFENLAKYLKPASCYSEYLLEDLEELVESTNSIFPFKLENVIVSCSDFNRAKGPSFGQVRDCSRRNKGHKRLSECSLLEAEFLCWLYKLDDEEEDKYLTPEQIIGNLFWYNLYYGKIPPSAIDIFLEGSVFEEIRETLTGEQILELFQRNMISFADFFKALVNREGASIMLKPLGEELRGILERGEELKLWKELANYELESELFTKAGSTFELSNIVKLLEICSKAEDVMNLLSVILFKIQHVLCFEPSSIIIDDKAMLREEIQEYSTDPLADETGSRTQLEMLDDSKPNITDCNMQEIVTIFNTYKSDNNEEVNKLFAYILLCAVNIEESLRGNASYEVPEYFFAYAPRLPSERLEELIQAGLVPAKFRTNPSVLHKD